jgi:hypothetical protein
MWLQKQVENNWRSEQTADPSTAFGAKKAPNFAQDDNSYIYQDDRNYRSLRLPLCAAQGSVGMTNYARKQ